MACENDKLKPQGQFAAIRHLFVARPRLMFSVVAGVVMFFALSADFSMLMRFLLAWNTCSWLYLISLSILMFRAPGKHIRAVAKVQDENAKQVLAFVCLAAVASLVAIVLGLAMDNQLKAWFKYAPLLLAFMTVAGSWLLVPTSFAIHYAHLYYQHQGKTPLLLFAEQPAEPTYPDFLYFSFTIAVASQTADVGVGSGAMRRLVLLQSILSFVFNMVILGLSVNIGASLLV
ncbi:DUF1345 domain-containing protein [Deefgea piscis]|uniref:DUF1345 domain-containing protein n=1 Tax=Deefgea piscis TaxID=2739061 RepID=UPI001C815F8F|nr:DUF1345 domain-containing protein [Deefgea piscis]QZA81960.1 DUF1345 domain-containing protein [Deefgea piscis]